MFVLGKVSLPDTDSATATTMTTAAKEKTDSPNIAITPYQSDLEYAFFTILLGVINIL